MPDDYVPPEAEPARATPDATWKEATAEERARIRQDAVVRQALDLFDGALISVKTRAVPAPGAAE